MNATLDRPLDRLLAKLWTTPAGQEIVREDAEQALASRQFHINGLVELERCGIAERPKLLKAQTEAAAKVRAAAAALKTAEASLARASAEVLGLSAECFAQRNIHTAALEQSAPPAIDEFLGRLEAERDRLRREGPTSTESRSQNVRTLGERIVQNNVFKIHARIRAIVDAIQAAQAFKLQNLDAASLQKRIDAIWAGLPDTNLEATT